MELDILKHEGLGAHLLDYGIEIQEAVIAEASYGIIKWNVPGKTPGRRA